MAMAARHLRPGRTRIVVAPVAVVAALSGVVLSLLVGAVPASAEAAVPPSSAPPAPESTFTVDPPSDLSRAVPSSWATVAAGGTQTCGILTDGTLWCWGDNYDGQLGDGTQLNRETPVPVVGDATWTQVDTGGQHTCAIRTDGTLWCWGDNTVGQVGDGTNGTSYLHHQPTQIGTDADWSSVATGYYHTCGIRTDGSLWCWGENSQGQLGFGRQDQDGRVPTRVGTERAWATVTAGMRHTCATRTDGSLWCWGDNSQGQVGDGTKTSRDRPTALGGTDWTAVSAGRLHSCGLRADGSLWCWGSNTYGQLGNGTRANTQVPSAVEAGTTWTAVRAGHSHSCALSTTRLVWCWGDNADGRLGDGATTASTVPVATVVAFAWTAVSVGIDHSCAIRPDGSLWCWGANDYGQLGDPTAPDRPVEARLPETTPSPGEDLPAPIAHATGADDVLVQVTRTGGFAGVHQVLYTLYGDGTVVVPETTATGGTTGTTRRFTLDEAGIQRVLIAARDAGLLATTPIDYGHPGISDAFQTTVVLNAAGRALTRDAYAMEFTDSVSLSAAQRAARETLMAFIDSLPDAA
jgi:alpha-tubulin suppressor-like RCC1 family protein